MEKEKSPEGQEDEIVVIEYKTSKENKEKIQATSDLLDLSQDELIRIIFKLGLRQLKQTIVFSVIS